MKKKSLLCILLALAMVLALAACGNGANNGNAANAGDDATAGEETSNGEDAANSGDAAETTADGAVFKIGGTGPLTGGAAIYGNAVKNGAQMAADEINAAGGVNGYLLDVRYEDDTHDPEKAVNAYNVLKDWGMQISMGSVTSKPGEATSAENFADRIFALTPSASSVATVEGKDNVFQMCFTDPNQGTASAQYISEQKLGTKIAVIYNNSDAYSTGIYTKFAKEAEELGLEIVSATTFTDDTATDFSVQLNDAKNAGADLLFLPIYYTPASLILQQADSMGYAPKFFGVDGMDGILDMEGFDTSLAEGVMLLTPFSADADDAATQNFVAKYQEKYGETPNQFAADTYDCVYMIYNALQTAGVSADMSNEDICDALIGVVTSGDFSFNGLTGDKMTWSDSGEVSKDPKGMVIQNGAYVGME